MRPRPVVGEATVPNAVRRLQDKFDYPDRESEPQTVPVLSELTGISGSIAWVEVNTPPTTGWSWVNQGSATERLTDEGSLLLNTPLVGANNLVLRVRSLSAPKKITAYLEGFSLAGGQGGPGLVLRESSTGKITIFYRKIQNSNQALLDENWTNATTFSAGVIGAQAPENKGIWLEVEDDNTDIIMRASASGHTGTYIQHSSVGRTSFMAGGPDQVGWAVRDNSAEWNILLHSWTEE